METFDLYSDPLGVSEIFVDLPKDEHPAFRTVRLNEVENIKEALNGGFDINTRHEETPGDKIYTIKWLTRQIRLKQYTVLHMAVVHGNIEVLELLLLRGADVNISDGNSISPVSVAAALQRADVVQRLIEAGADLNIQSISGRTPLIQAITVLNLRIVEMLLSAGADPNLGDSKGTTPLFTCLIANDNRNLDILKALITGGSDIEHANKQGATPLMTAVGLGRHDAVKVLVDAGAEINRVDNAGKSIFQFALGVRMALYLINMGASVDTCDKQGQRALDWAAHVGHIGMLRLLLGVDCERPPLSVLDVPRVVQARQSVPVFDAWITQELTQPRELKRICRGVIRQALSPSNMSRVDQLPLPALVKNFILAKNMDLSFGGLSIDKWQRMAGLPEPQHFLLPRQLGRGAVAT